MSSDEIIRAWKNPKYRKRLSVTKQRLLPENPAGIIELDDGDLRMISGGTADCTEPGCSSCTALTCLTACSQCCPTVTGDPCVACK
jgi:mersacidin/lichenicidin family type 2 lantibiotic